MLQFEQFKELTIDLCSSQFLVSCLLLTTIFCVNRVKLCNIQALVNAAGYGLNVSNQLVLNILQIVAII